MSYERISALVLGSLEAAKVRESVAPAVYRWISDLLEHAVPDTRLVPLEECPRWKVDGSGIAHESGRFFKISGFEYADRVSGVQFGATLIVQEEIGLLGLICREVKGDLELLVQGKIEPGNINYLQLSPTVQATRANFERVHQGKSTPYLEWFLAPRSSQVVYDQLQSEQNSTFYRKRNRNVIVLLEPEEEPPVLEGYAWLSFGDVVRHLMPEKNLINMDLRSLLAGIVHYAGATIPSGTLAHEVLMKLSQAKFEAQVSVRFVPLSDLADWKYANGAFRSEKRDLFGVVAVHFSGKSREIPSWFQPLVEKKERGLFCLFTKAIDGTPHYLLRASSEIGTFDKVELAPTINYLGKDLADLYRDDQAMLLEFLRTSPPSNFLYDTIMSEEGGRFYHGENRYVVLKVDGEVPMTCYHFWVSEEGLRELVMIPNVLSIEARTLLAAALGRS